MLSHKSDEWYTPQDLFDRLHQEFNFTLDPCATDENHKLPKYYTQEDDGLTQDWSGEVVFCNPPYSKVKQWIQKSYEESLKGAMVVLLIPARTDTIAWHTYIFPHANNIRFLKGRLKFGDSKNSAPFPSAVVVFGGDS